MNKNITIVLFSLLSCGFSILSMESKYDRGRRQGDDKETEVQKRERVQHWANEIERAINPAKTTQEEFKEFKKALSNALTDDDLKMPNTLYVGNCARVPGSFKDWVADQISNCDHPSGEYLGTVSREEAPKIIAEHKARNKERKNRLLEIQTVLGLKSTNWFGGTESNADSTIFASRIPLRLITAGLLACIGFGLYFLINNKKNKPSASKGSGNN